MTDSPRPVTPDEVPGRVRDELDAMRERDRLAADCGYPRDPSDVPRVLKALGDVLELHQPQMHQDIAPGEPDGPYCAGCAIDCSDEDEDPFSSGAWRSWPCPTYKAISSALLGKETGDG